MKKILYIITLLLCSISTQSISAQEQKVIDSQLIYVSFDKAKHIVLPAQVSDISSGRSDLILVERVENVPNIVRVTAQQEDFYGMTNLVIVCTDGSVYSFKVGYLFKGSNETCSNIIYAGGDDKSHFYDVAVNRNNTTEMFFPEDVLYLKQGNEEVFGVEYYNNMVKVNTDFEKFENSNLFVVDKGLNTYEITLIKDCTNSYSYNFDDGRRYIAHIDANSIEMDNLINKIHFKKRNIYSLGIIRNKFEVSLANLYVRDDFMFFVFDIKNFSNIDYDIDFVKCFFRDQKKMKNAVQQEVPYEPVHQKDFSQKIVGKSTNRFVLAFNKFTIPDDKVFEIEMFERGGGRHIKLPILNEYILSAELLK